MEQTKSTNQAFKIILLAGGLLALSGPIGWAAGKVAPVLTFSESWKDFPGCTGSGDNLSCNEYGAGAFTIKAIITSNDFGTAIDLNQFNADTTFDITLGNYSFSDTLGDAAGYVPGATKAIFKLITPVCNAAGTKCPAKVYETITLSWTRKAVTIAIAAKTGQDANGNTFESDLDASTYDGNDSGPLPGGSTVAFEMDLGDTLTVSSDALPETGTVATKTDANGDDLSTIKIKGTLTADELGGSVGAETLTNLYTFTGGADGGNSVAGLVPGKDGNFYGTTQVGGVSNNGTVFQVSSNGTLNPLFSFTEGTDGALPNGLVQGSDGNFYGTTQGDGNGPSANGTVFQITPTGTLTTLYAFTGGADSDTPLAPLVQGSDSNFYGTTFGDGSGDDQGTVFKISSAGTLTTLYTFSGGTDGGEPIVGVVLGKDGNFYGTTEQGGTSGNGSIFKISPTGAFTTLYSFADLNDGGDPGALILGKDGSFYGTTSEGGTEDWGTVFKFNPVGAKLNPKINPTGTLTTLYNFTGQDDGNGPAALVQGKDGNFYGTTQNDGVDGEGTVFKMSRTGTLTTLYSFTGDTDGSNPNGVVQGNDGNFYGTTQDGGDDGAGTVFEIGAP